MDQRSKPFEAIIGAKLSAVTFVLDYWQLQFDGPMIDQFRNLVCEQIGKVVASVALLQREAFVITFEDQSLIRISLRWEDYRGPEAMILYGPDLSTVMVVRADD